MTVQHCKPKHLAGRKKISTLLFKPFINDNENNNNNITVVVVVITKNEKQKGKITEHLFTITKSKQTQWCHISPSPKDDWAR